MDKEKRYRAMLSLLVLCAWGTFSQAQRSYDMDEFATCSTGRTLIVDDQGILLNARGTTAPSNPPTSCIVHLLSTYRDDDGTNKLQMEVLSFQAKGCEVSVNVYNGHRASGQYVQSLGCDKDYGTGIFYSTGNELTIRMTRPDNIVHNEYRFTLFFKPWKDLDATPTVKKVDSLSIAAIIGIVIGAIVVIAIIILFCWCCCTGRLGNFNIPGRSLRNPYGNAGGANEKYAMGNNANKSVTAGNGKPGVLNLNDPQVWNTVTTGKYEPGRHSQRYQNRPGNMMLGRRFERNDYRDQGWQEGHDYEPYDVDPRQGQGDYDRYQNQRRSPKDVRQPQKETTIDDVFESDSNKGSEKTGDTDIDDATLQKRKHGDTNVPEEGTLARGSPQLDRYLSIDLSSQPDHDTISSPLHINAGVRASVDDEAGSPSGSLRKKKGGNKSPKSKRKNEGKEPDPMALPPEAFEPIFTKPITGIDYQGSNRNLHNQPMPFPGGFIPYGFVPAGGFAPGTQTYAYAYQTVPQQGAPGQQGAWFVQNTPTTEGNRRTAFAMEETIPPNKQMSTPERKRKKNADPFRRGGNRGGKDSAPDLAIIARGAAPPDPGRGHRSIEMKSGMDPDNKVHTTQVLWTDTVPDATDPKPNENPQITRKTITRVTTKSGCGDLPQHATLLALDDADPSFLSPSSKSHAHPPAMLPPSAASPANENLAFYTGAPAIMEAPERSFTPPSTHNAPAYNAAIRDRIPFDSTV